MVFFQSLGHDWQKNVIKRTPPMFLLKRASRIEENYADIFGNSGNDSAQPGIDKMLTAGTEHSSILPSPRLAFQIALDYARESLGLQTLTFQNDFPLKKIDPGVMASAIATTPTVKKKTLINLINHLHFIKGQILIHIHDDTTSEEYFLRGEQEPYLDDKIIIRFTDPGAFNLSRHTPLNIVIDDHKSLIVFPVDLEFISQESLTLRLPEMAHSYGKRQAVRYKCEGVAAEIVQGKIKERGFLEDINSRDLRVYLNAPLADINPVKPLFFKLTKGKQTHFMGECRLVQNDNNGSFIILQPTRSNCPVLTTSKNPDCRVRIMPQPDIHFIHPLCGIAVQHKVGDISASGFSVTVREEESFLILGMVIPWMTLELPGMLEVNCSAQVIYRRKQKDLVRYGFYILDMTLHDQRHLFDAVSKAADPHVNVTGKVDLDSLWELFFASNFIYSDKYGHISPDSDKLKETYRKLYEEGQNIFTHVTYQDQGQIYGHLSMIKAYDDSWLIHHLAARPMHGIHTGLKVLNHFVNYVGCLWRLPVSSKDMRFNLFYYRPDNYFPEYFFGGFYRHINRREICSQDLYAYMDFEIKLKQGPLPEGWDIAAFSYEHLALLQDHYDLQGGGLMLKAFALSRRASENFLQTKASDVRFPDSINGTIEEMYRQVGLLRSSAAYSLEDRGKLKAVLIVDRSDMGINMSELLNSIKVIVVDNTLPWTILQQAVNTVGVVYDTDTTPVLVFPFAYLKKQGIESKRQYYMWVVDTNLNWKYIDFLKGLVKIKKSKFIALYIKHSLSSFLKWAGLIKEHISKPEHQKI